MESSTKNRILDEALVMFAENGYKGTNLRDLAARLGLSKSALYKHYESKEAIWNALLHGMSDEETVRFASACSGVAISRFPLPLNPPTLEEVNALIARGN